MKLTLIAAALAVISNVAVAAEPPLDIWASDVGEQIAARCAKEWPDSFRMRVHCENKETEAVNTLRQRHPKPSQLAIDSVACRAEQHLPETAPFEALDIAKFSECMNRKGVEEQ